MEKPRYHFGVGRRKEAVARVRLYPGTGVITVNGKTSQDYFGVVRFTSSSCSRRFA